MKHLADFTARSLLCLGIILLLSAPFWWPAAAVGAGLVLVGWLWYKKGPSVSKIDARGGKRP